MKYIFLIFISLTVSTQCNVFNRSAELTTQVFDDWKNRENESKAEIKNYKSVTENHVYLDDVTFSLNKQNWTEEEKPCLDQIRRLLSGLQNFTLWAVWDWDAQSPEPQGLLFGNKYQLGNFDQCMSAPWTETHSELNTKYCLADIRLERTDKEIRKKIHYPFDPYRSALDFIEFRPPHSRPLNELKWGACVPSSCLPRTVEKLLAVMLARSHLGTAGMKPSITIKDECQTRDSNTEGDALYYTFIAMVVSLVLVSLVCTYLGQCKELDPDALSTGIIKSFCIKENARNLLNVKREDIEVMYGIRFLTMCLIVFDHQIGISNAGPISDGLITDQITHTVLGMMILHNDLFVDTFFMLSGFLTVNALVKIKKLPNPIFMILRRYVRLVVALAVVVFYVCAMFPYSGSGPLWGEAKRGEVYPCKKNWWLNMLMLNNYVDTHNICIIVSWYIPCDFHFFVVTVLIYWVYRRCPRLGVGAAIIVTIAAVIAPGVINYVYDLPAIQLFTFKFVSNPRASDTFHRTYIKSHTRYAAYLVGFFSGYFFCSCSTNGNHYRLSKKWAVLGSVLSIVVMVGVMVLGSTYLYREYSPLEGAVYAALNRPVWACACAALVLCCAMGSVPFVKSFLSWYPWVPLSRMAYGVYLTHTVIITRNVFVTRNPQHNDHFEILNSAMGVIFWSCLAALMLWLFAEAPANNLLALCLKSQIKKFKKKQEERDPNRISNASSIPTASGYLKDNLPTTIQFSSKM